MFDEPSPEEKVHLRLLEALTRLDHQKVRDIGQAHPLCVHGRQGFMGSPMQRLMAKRDLLTPSNIWPCLDALIDCGARLGDPYSHMESPLQTLLRWGDVATLRHLFDGGRLGEAIEVGVKSDRCLHFVCTSTQWRDLGKKYPILPMVELLLEAGDLSHVNLVSKQSAMLQLLWCALPIHGHQTPQQIEDALLLLMQHDDTPVSPTHLSQAFYANMPSAFDALAKRHFSSLDLDEMPYIQEDFNAVAALMKPEQAIEFEAWWIKAQTAQAAPQEDSVRRLRL